MTEKICKAKWHGVTAAAFLAFVCYAKTISLIISINRASFPLIICHAFKIKKTFCCLFYYFIAYLICHRDSLNCFSFIRIQNTAIVKTGQFMCSITGQFYLLTTIFRSKNRQLSFVDSCLHWCIIEQDQKISAGRRKASPLSVSKDSLAHAKKQSGMHR
jgi:hypothetical protein